MQGFRYYRVRHHNIVEMPDDTRKVVIKKMYCPACYRQFEGEAEVCPDDKTKLCLPGDSPLVGQVFAERYVIDSVLGLGGMSIVYKATHKLMNRTVAIKMLKKKLMEDVLLLERFRVEAQAASSLNHQNIITIYDFGVTWDNEPYLVMDCLDGESLDDLIERSGPLPVQRALPIFKQICDGLDAAHKKGIIHRDLKPANVVLLKNEDGSDLIKLVDFGIAKVVPQEGQQGQRLTQTGELFGSPIYMSPEQCQGRALDARSDLYGLGCLMYEVLVGSPPFIGQSFLETLNMHVNDVAKPLSEAAPKAEIPLELEQVIMQCMAKEPTDRFNSAAEIRDFLSAISVNMPGGAGDGTRPGGITTSILKQTGGQTQTTVAPCPNTKRPPFLYIGGTVVLVLGGVLAFMCLFPGPELDRGSPMDKIMWQVGMSNADDAIKKGDYASAEGWLKMAEQKTKNFSDGDSRLEATLKQKSVLYDKWDGHALELETANKEITRIQVAQLTREYQHRLASLAALSQSGDSGVQAEANKLRAEAQLPGILSTAARLYGRSMYNEDEELLRKTLDLSHKILGRNAVLLAPVETRLAECLMAQRKFPQVREYLSHSVALWRDHQDGHEAEFARALNKLGQFDLDQSDYKNARPELEEALRVARTANDQDILLLCLRSYADLLQQQGEKAESTKIYAEADALSKSASPSK